MPIPEGLETEIRKWAEVRIAKEKADAVAKAAEAAFKAQTEILHDLLNDGGISIEIEGLGKFFPSSRGPFLKLPKDPIDGVDESDWPVSEETRKKMEDWADAIGLKDELFKYQMQTQRTNSTLGKIISGDLDLALPDPAWFSVEDNLRWTKSVTWQKRPEHLKAK